MDFSTNEIKPEIGSRVILEKSALADIAVVEALRGLLEERGVLVFPRIGLTDSEQLDLTTKFGTPVQFFDMDGGESPFYKISLDPEQVRYIEYVQATYFWHMDGLTAGKIPPRATFLTARQVAREGGQTEFANTYLAFERLPQAMKDRIDGLKVVHNMRASMFDIFNDLEETGHWSRVEKHLHPLVWTHSSGRKSLVLAATGDHIEGMPRADGRALLARLLQWTAQPEFCYCHEWQEGDLVIWDNCGTLHRVVPYDAQSGRLMHRTTIEGVEPIQ